jgi:hypothetical protein
MSLYNRTGSVMDMVVDRWANGPDDNEESTAAMVNELHAATVQILADSAPGTFRPKLLQTLPVYEVLRGQRHRHQWEKKMMAWEKTLTKGETRAWRHGALVMWHSVSNSVESDRIKAAQRLCDHERDEATG